MTDENVLRFPGESNATDPGLSAAIEALLFAAGEAITVKDLCEALGDVGPKEVREALHQLSATLQGRGVQLVVVAGAWQLRTNPEFSEMVLRMRKERPRRMSKAALEVLAVVAYRQPVTRGQIDDLRGVSSGNVLRGLLDKGYVRVRGRTDDPGRPLMYGTTSAFLEVFSLPGLGALPTLEEREELEKSVSTPVPDVDAD